jgi:hypothetical protein
MTPTPENTQPAQPSQAEFQELLRGPVNRHDERNHTRNPIKPKFRNCCMTAYGLPSG